jgi:UDP-N-acetylmuramate: L-alanyl-gamma-D-glutamyl-meso-diaminopimelate ligase
MRKYVHFIGIAGKTMAPLAKMFKDKCWRVTGSDHAKTYPPISTYLRRNRISYHQGYAESNLIGRPNLVIVGRSALLIDPQNPEYLKAKKLGLRIFSHPETLREYVVKKNSIVVAGTYGKTTVSALVAWILEKAGLKPSFMIGGIPLNFPDGVRSNDSLWSVVEGDEPPAMRETDPPKFMFYKPKYVLLTACRWDHPEVFPSERAYLDAFARFVKLVPKGGLIVTCWEGGNVRQVVKEAKGRVIWYSAKKAPKADFWVKNVLSKKNFTQFEVVSRKQRDILMIESPLLGLHNVQNVCGAVGLSLSLGIKPAVVQEAIRTFKDVRTRLEFVGEFRGTRVFWDLAQHPIKVKETLAALRTLYKKEKIIAVFDPHQTMLQRRESLAWYPGCFDQADEVIVAGVSFGRSIPKKERVTGKDIVGAIQKTNPQVKYLPRGKEVMNCLVKNCGQGTVIIFLSSGGLRVPGMIQKLAKKW